MTGDGPDAELGRRARRLVASWPEGAAVVGLVGPADAGPGAFACMAELADASARERRTLLANLSAAGAGLDAHLGVAGGSGLLDAGRSGRSLRELARRPDGRGFPYLPAGGRSPAEGEEDDLRSVRTRLLALMARVARRVRERDGRLLLVLPGDADWPDALPGLVDGVVLVEGAERPAWVEGGSEVFGRLASAGGEGAQAAGPVPADAEAAPDAPDGVPAAAPAAGGGDARDDGGGEAGVAGDREGSPWRRHRRSSGLPWTRIAAGAAVLLALAAGWWWLVRQTADVPAGAGTGAGGSVAAAPGSVAATPAGTGADGGDAAEASAGPSRAADDGGGGERAAAEVLAGAPELPYSVLIASYARWEQARQRLERWRGPGATVYFVAPTRVRGGLYWRLFAGAAGDRPTGVALMERLVEAGRKDRARAWDVRPVELAFLLETAASREAGRRRVRALEDRGIPAYTLAAASGGDTVWPVYGGGFESADEAADFRRILEETGIEAELTTRRGESESR